MAVPIPRRVVVWRERDTRVESIKRRSYWPALDRRPAASPALRQLVTVDATRHRRVSTTRYAVESCESNWYSHKYEDWLRLVLKVACRELYPYLPFVFRNESRDDGKIVEVLKVGDRVISTIELNAD